MTLVVRPSGVSGSTTTSPPCRLTSEARPGRVSHRAKPTALATKTNTTTTLRLFIGMLPSRRPGTGGTAGRHYLRPRVNAREDRAKIRPLMAEQELLRVD